MKRSSEACTLLIPRIGFNEVQQLAVCLTIVPIEVWQ